MDRARNARAMLLLVSCVFLFSTTADAFCWGSLRVLSQSQRLNNNCPAPSLTKTWRVSCLDGCGYSSGKFTEALVGFGECFKGSKCKKGVVCLPFSGAEIRGFNPPSLSSSIVNRGGYYSAGWCQRPRCRTTGVSTTVIRCNCHKNFDLGWCAQNDPVIVSLRDASYRLTDRSHGVEFDLGGSGSARQVPWTDPRSDEAFLALDRNENGSIDDGSELFGDVTPQHASEEPNGFRALEIFDDSLSGGNEDGLISIEDEIFSRLLLWHDRNHDGASQADELMSLASAGLEWIDLSYLEVGRRDRYGNDFRYRAQSAWTNGSRRSVWNVFLIAD